MKNSDIMKSRKYCEGFQDTLISALKDDSATSKFYQNQIRNTDISSEKAVIERLSYEASNEYMRSNPYKSDIMIGRSSDKCYLVWLPSLQLKEIVKHPSGCDLIAVNVITDQGIYKSIITTISKIEELLEKKEDNMVDITAINIMRMDIEEEDIQNAKLSNIDDIYTEYLSSLDLQCDDEDFNYTGPAQAQLTLSFSQEHKHLTKCELTSDIDLYELPLYAVIMINYTTDTIGTGSIPVTIGDLFFNTSMINAKIVSISENKSD